MATQADFDRIDNYARISTTTKTSTRRKCNRVVPMEIFCLCYSRAGTLSMRKALDILEFPKPYHFSSFYDNLQNCDKWLQLAKAKFEGKGTYGKEDIDKLLGHCGAVMDMPRHLFTEETIEWYPEAKVVLVELNIDSWCRPWSAFLTDAMSPAFPIPTKLDPSFRPHRRCRYRWRGQANRRRKYGRCSEGKIEGDVPETLRFCTICDAQGEAAGI